jgi:hypothetical protein
LIKRTKRQKQRKNEEERKSRKRKAKRKWMQPNTRQFVSTRKGRIGARREALPSEQFRGEVELLHLSQKDCQLAFSSRTDLILSRSAFYITDSIGSMQF